ncbi:hypothetical protein JB92DRAFT_2838732 [Gautieria morchelliformis]|nr:hypothetical protein JB92DRAFT_2838732 [Gautieria morchelliformis]
MAQQIQYPFSIPSISKIHPAIPAHIINTLCLNQGIATGDAIEIHNAEWAQGVVNSWVYLNVDSKPKHRLEMMMLKQPRNRAAVIRNRFDDGTDCLDISDNVAEHSPGAPTQFLESQRKGPE